MADTATVTTVETVAVVEVLVVTELALRPLVVGRVTRWSLVLVVPVALARKVSTGHKVEHRRCSLLVPQEVVVADTTKVVTDRTAGLAVGVQQRQWFRHVVVVESVAEPQDKETTAG